MKPRILHLLGFMLLVLVLLMGTWGSAEALELTLYDNFEQAPLNPDKWLGSEFEYPYQYGRSFVELVRRTIQDDEGRHLRILARSVGEGANFSLFRLKFTNPEAITAIRSRVKVQNFESRGCPDSPTSVNPQIFGFFFNTDTTGTAPRDGTNDVIAAVGVTRDSNSPFSPDVLHVFYFVLHCLDFDCVSTVGIGGGNLGTVTKGQWVRLLLQWDQGNHQFIFQRDRETPATVGYNLPDTQPPGIQLKTLGVSNFVANCDVSPRPVGMADALFDNVFVNQSALP